MNGDRELQSGAYAESFAIDDDTVEEVTATPFCDVYNKIAEGLDIRLNHRVKEIDYNGQIVAVTCCDGQVFVADKVIVTLPVGVLKMGVVCFKPELPVYKQEAIENLETTSQNGFLLVFDRVFWDNKLVFSYLADECRKYCWYLNYNYMDPQNFSLKTSCYANCARESEFQTDEEVINEIMTNLRDIYGPEIPDPIKFYRSKWVTNPNFYGSSNFLGLKSKPSYYQDLADPVLDKVFFAGEATSTTDNCYVQGAYDSGIREAKRIITLMNANQQN